MRDRRVMRADSPERAGLEGRGWVVVARSWGAGLVIDERMRDRLRERVRDVHPLALRELGPGDVDAVLALDRETLDDYPGDVATAHDALTVESATPAPAHRGWGVFAAPGLVAMSFLSLGALACDATETDFTVVDGTWRDRGLGAAVKAASVLALADEGRRMFRTGGSFDNPASIAANRAVGYRLDEEWLTLAPPVAAPGPSAPTRLD
ncbi:acetyltransferase [Herbiconiux sp. CPCC 205716]|uniref:Acetyltransferase n=1 Tax=Herbiconiux gentiana TaxID=2970912 RepID=A0ABT2GHB5_9MICO|nr:acetyltransferase [Herbiconiux gentiana]MCS5715568.1 acetyltransferase [Herbiconiux gentiana]